MNTVKAHTNFTMFELINFSEIFTTLIGEYYEKYKNNNGSIKKYLLQTRYLSLLSFIYNSCYWSRFNKNPETGKWLPDCITGKYLNEIHLFLVKHNFYRTLYSYVLNIYLRVTNYQTLQDISVDSCFIRNILGTYLSRNPNYYNKPGLKVHAIVDLYRVPISFIVTDCNVSDSVVVKLLIEKAFINIDIMNNHCQTFLADSAYSGFITTEYITSLGLNVIIGRNRQHTKKVLKIKTVNANDLKTYKKRGIVENFFSNFLRVPCLINNYEKSVKSYEGIALFYMASYLAKKVNNIIKIQNDEKSKEEYERQLIRKREDVKRRKLKKYEIARNRKVLIEKEKQERDKSTELIVMRIKRKIRDNIDKSYAKRHYTKSVKAYNKKKITTRGRSKDTSYCKYEDHLVNCMYTYMINDVLTNTYSYKFCSKNLYLIKGGAYCFSDDNIDEQMKLIDINEKIRVYALTFFTI